MRGTQGTLIVASTLQIVVGFSGLWRNVVRFLSPLSAVPLLAKCVEIGLPDICNVTSIFTDLKITGGGYDTIFATSSADAVFSVVYGCSVGFLAYDTGWLAMQIQHHIEILDCIFLYLVQSFKSLHFAIGASSIQLVQAVSLVSTVNVAISNHRSDIDWLVGWVLAQNAELLLKPLNLNHPVLSKTVLDKFAALGILQVSSLGCFLT
ncbi:Nucleobase-ascorbate transporter [Vigna angularis]|uniref:Nucleobase-ascorbate transporter n=1 Tax=Phaseolus angularis TaxID=3914 RepID=A0A8T0KPT9_PHAAN|nr:Nucleobase-ascorbate transporter [Vigna angularis]